MVIAFTRWNTPKGATPLAEDELVKSFQGLEIGAEELGGQIAALADAAHLCDPIAVAGNISR